jgi:hypothetical protein
VLRLVELEKIFFSPGIVDLNDLFSPGIVEINVNFASGIVKLNVNFEIKMAETSILYNKWIPIQQWHPF